MYSVKELEKMLKQEENYLKELMLDVKVVQADIQHLKRCVTIAKEKEK